MEETTYIVESEDGLIFDFTWEVLTPYTTLTNFFEVNVDITKMQLPKQGKLLDLVFMQKYLTTKLQPEVLMEVISCLDYLAADDLLQWPLQTLSNYLHQSFNVDQQTKLKTMINDLLAPELQFLLLKYLNGMVYQSSIISEDKLYNMKAASPNLYYTIIDGISRPQPLSSSIYYINKKIKNIPMRKDSNIDSSGVAYHITTYGSYVKLYTYENNKEMIKSLISVPTVNTGQEKFYPMTIMAKDMSKFMYSTEMIGESSDITIKILYFDNQNTLQFKTLGFTIPHARIHYIQLLISPLLNTFVLKNPFQIISVKYPVITTIRPAVPRFTDIFISYSGRTIVGQTLDNIFYILSSTGEILAQKTMTMNHGSLAVSDQYILILFNKNILQVWNVQTFSNATEPKFIVPLPELDVPLHTRATYTTVITGEKDNEFLLIFRPKEGGTKNLNWYKLRIGSYDSMEEFYAELWGGRAEKIRLKNKTDRQPKIKVYTQGGYKN